jgi:hypothetical protein
VLPPQVTDAEVRRRRAGAEALANARNTAVRDRFVERREWSGRLKRPLLAAWS